MKFIYVLSEKAIKAEFVASGRQLEKEQECFFSPDELTEEDRQFIYDRLGGIQQKYMLAVPTWNGIQKCRYMARLELDQIVTDAADLLHLWRLTYQTQEEQVAETQRNYLKAKFDELDTSGDAYPYEYAYRSFAGTEYEQAAQQKFTAAMAAFEQKREVLRLEQQARENEKLLAEGSRLRDMHAWIEIHGSDYLKRLMKGTYKGVLLQYVLERAAIDMPEYIVCVSERDEYEYNDDDYDEAVDRPSVTMLDEADRVGGIVIRTNRYLNATEWVRGETVKVENWLGTGYKLYYKTEE